MMPWIKSHLSVVIAGSVSLLALVALVLGVFMSDVAAGMSQDAALLGQLQNPGGLPNSALLELRRQQLERHEKLLKELEQTVKMTGERKPLEVAKDIFPKENPANQNAPFEFKRDYRKAQQALLTMLKAQDKPTESEIAEEAQKIIRRLAQDAKDAGKPGDLGKNQPGPKPSVAGSLAPLGQGPANQLAPGQLRPDATPEERLRADPVCRAAVAKAHRKDMWCYASLASLDPRPAITDNEQRPLLDDMWYAQVSLWIQEDVLGALARLNEERAKTLATDADKWVGNMPFKHLLSFVVGGYVPPATSAESGPIVYGGGDSGGFGGPPPMNASAVLSKNGCSDTVDVIQFTMEIIVEARALPDVIDKISESGYYTVLQLSYEAVPPNLDMVDYIYGSEPSLRVWLLCEGSLLRDDKNSYTLLMPETVKTDIKAGKPVGSGTGVGGGGGFGPGPGLSPGRMMPMGPGGPMYGPGGGGGDPRFGRGRGMPPA